VVSLAQSGGILGENTYYGEDVDTVGDINIGVV